MAILSVSYNINKTKHHLVATILNDIVLSLIILITTVNVVIGVFDMRDPSESGAFPDGSHASTADPLRAARGLYDLQTS